ncbi:MAG: CPBP family intramembrane glutamic endopeptidase [Terracidiphilus sp.]|jgi:membrane protease YdiL (CAAX protease family)
MDIPQAPHEPLPRRNSLFFGRFGLRAGYGIAIFIVVAFLLIIASLLAGLAASGQLKDAIALYSFAKIHPHAPRPHFDLRFLPSLVIVNDGVMFFGLLATCCFFSKGERRPLRAYGIGGYRAPYIVAGAFWGIVMMGAMVAVLHAGHWLVFDGRLLHGTPAVTYGLAWLFAFLLTGLSEEYTFRGYLQYSLMRGVWRLAEIISPTNTRAVAFWIAAAITSLLFAFAHTGNSGENFIGLAQVFFAGVAFVYALWRTGSLWWSIGFHMTWDWAQSYLFGVADSGNVSIGRLFATHPAGNIVYSGGTAGPEGSIFAPIALLITILIIRFTTRPGTQPVLEQEPARD